MEEQHDFISTEERLALLLKFTRRIKAINHDLDFLIHKQIDNRDTMTAKIFFRYKEYKMSIYKSFKACISLKTNRSMVLSSETYYTDKLLEEFKNIMNINKQYKEDMKSKQTE